MKTFKVDIYLESHHILGNREFSFTLKDDVYIRYLSFASPAELEKELMKKVPFKIDIGAVYNYKVSMPFSHNYRESNSK